MARAKEETAVVKKEALAVASYGEDVALGFENTTPDDISLPFLTLLQDLSPEVTGDKGQGIDGAKAGMLYNSVTKQTFDKTLFVPAWHEHLFVEWIPRKQGGGFVARHELTSDVVKAAKEASTKFGKYSVGTNDLVETQYLYGVICGPDDSQEMGVIGFTSTKLKIFRDWWTRVNMFLVPQGDRKVRPPLFAHLVEISTRRQTNREGQSFSNFVLKAAAQDNIKASLLSPDDSRYQAAKGLQEMVRKGMANINYESQTVEEPVVSAF